MSMRNIPIYLFQVQAAAVVLAYKLANNEYMAWR